MDGTFSSSPLMFNQVYCIHSTTIMSDFEGTLAEVLKGEVPITLFQSKQIMLFSIVFCLLRINKILLAFDSNKKNHSKTLMSLRLDARCFYIIMCERQVKSNRRN